MLSRKKITVLKVEVLGTDSFYCSVGGYSVTAECWFVMISEDHKLLNDLYY